MLVESHHFSMVKHLINITDLKKLQTTHQFSFQLPDANSNCLNENEVLILFNEIEMVFICGGYLLILYF